MRYLHDQGDLIWYYDEWFGKCGIGLVIDIEEIDRSGYVSYIVMDPHNNISLGEYSSDSFISVLGRHTAPICAYDNKYDFYESRGVKKI